MKKKLCTLLACALATALLLGMAACGNAGRTNNVRVLGGKSTKFNAAEIEAAQDCVLKKFKDFEGCDLEKLWYDEESSDVHIESYLSTGRGSENGVNKENVIILLSNFRVDSTGGGGFNPNSTYTDWNWILIRDDKSGAWRVDDWGY